MIAAFDVYYFSDDSAQVAAVLFSDFKSDKNFSTYKKKIDKVSPYVPGSFYQRELPCILELLSEIKENIAVILVDGYVTLGDRPGLGAYLADALKSDVVIIGVAKSCFLGAPASEVTRGSSKKPLFITSFGCSVTDAADNVKSMHGEHRIPDLLKIVDLLSKDSDMK